MPDKTYDGKFATESQTIILRNRFKPSIMRQCLVKLFTNSTFFKSSNQHIFTCIWVILDPLFVCVGWKQKRGCAASALTSPAVREGADWPKDWLLMRTKLLGSPACCCQASWLTPPCMLLDRGRSCFPVAHQKNTESGHGLFYIHMSAFCG